MITLIVKELGLSRNGTREVQLSSKDQILGVVSDEHALHPKLAILTPSVPGEEESKDRIFITTMEGGTINTGVGAVGDDKYVLQNIFIGSVRVAGTILYIFEVKKLSYEK